MLLKDFLERNAEDLIGQVFHWTFGLSVFELRIISKSRAEYRMPGKNSWNGTEIHTIRNFSVETVEVRRSHRKSTIHIKTDNP